MRYQVYLRCTCGAQGHGWFDARIVDWAVDQWLAVHRDRPCCRPEAQYQARRDWVARMLESLELELRAQGRGALIDQEGNA